MTKKKENNIEKVEVVESKIEKKTDYVLAIFLIFLGVVLLLNTTGIIGWNIWTVLWRFWPLLVVFAGLSLIFEGSKILSVLIGILALILLSLAFLWSAALVQTPRWFERVVEVETEVENSYTIFSEDFVGVEKKEIDIDMGIGSLSVTNEDLEDHLYLDAKYSSSLGEPVLKSKTVSNILDLSLELGKGSTTFFWGNRVAPKYSLVLGSTEVPTDLFVNVGAGQGELLLSRYDLGELDIKVGAGEAKSKLSDMNVDKLKMEVGTGNFVLDLDGDIEISQAIDVKVGVGKLTLTLPEGAKYKLTGNVGIGTIKTPEREISGFGSDVTEFKSVGYDSAENRFDIVADVGIGELLIK